MTLRVFPVAGETNFVDTFGAPRPGGRRHEGTDVFAPTGTPVRAVDDGRVTQHLNDPLGGNVARLEAADGSTYIYSHLDRFTGSPGAVKAGDELGTVGTTGNARGGKPHLHFEVLRGGSAVNPFPELQELVKPGSAAATSSKRAGNGLGLLVLLFVLYRSRRA